MRRLMAAVVSSVLVLALPAAAGTADNPEIVDDCGAQIRSDNDSITAVPGHVDVCAGWFDTTAKGLKVTLQTSTGLDNPEASGGGFWAVWWDNGDCTYEIAIDDTLNAANPRAFRVGCGDAPEPRCSPPIVALECNYGDHYRNIPLPPDSVVRDGNTLQVSLDFTGALAEFAPAHARGQVLSQPRVWASSVVGPVYAHSMGCSFGDYGTYCFEAGGSVTRVAV
jgi:hypothetical protein